MSESLDLERKRQVRVLHALQPDRKVISNHTVVHVCIGLI